MDEIEQKLTEEAMFISAFSSLSKDSVGYLYNEIFIKHEENIDTEENM